MLLKDCSFHELTTDWDARDMLGTIDGDPFDERSGGWPTLGSGQVVHLWWPDVSPRPVARATGDRWEVVSWGHAELGLLGATPRKVLRSGWSYPTGTELRQDKFAGPGPWRDVDWRMLRRKTRSVTALVSGPLGGAEPLALRDTLTLPVAARAARAGTRGDARGRAS